MEVTETTEKTLHLWHSSGKWNYYEQKKCQSGLIVPIHCCFVFKRFYANFLLSTYLFYSAHICFIYDFCYLCELYSTTDETCPGILITYINVLKPCPEILKAYSKHVLESRKYILHLLAKEYISTEWHNLKIWVTSAFWQTS